jgi:hypothetical protein
MWCEGPERGDQSPGRGAPVRQEEPEWKNEAHLLCEKRPGIRSGRCREEEGGTAPVEAPAAVPCTEKHEERGEGKEERQKVGPT